jgi:DMSO reductase family type II enzyme heme b subunit
VIRSRRARSAAGVVLLAFAVAGALTISGTRLAASQETVLTALRTEEEVPAEEPWATFWDGVPAVDVPLSAQTVTPPKGGRGSTMSARAVNDATNLYVLVEWRDSSADRSVGRTEDFSDAVAVQFPAVAGTQVPAFCMGDPTATVNVWQWRAAWQADVARGYQGTVAASHPDAAVDAYPFQDDQVFYPGRAVGNPMSATDRTSAVDNLVAAGFGSLTPDAFAQVTGWGEWRDGTWRVVFARPLQVGREGNVELYKDTWTDVAFAVWDGSAQERDGIKSVGNFVALDIEPRTLEPEDGMTEWPLLLVLGLWVLLALVIIIDLPGARR